MPALPITTRFAFRQCCPPSSRVVRRSFQAPPEEYGHRLYVVLAHLETRIHGESCSLQLFGARMPTVKAVTVSRWYGTILPCSPASPPSSP